MRKVILLKLCLLFGGLFFSLSAYSDTPIEKLFSKQQTIQSVLDIESALAQSQAALGIIPQWAANEITKKASIKYVSVKEWEAENAKVHQRMVAVLNVWTKKMDKKASEYVHFGATTMDIYDTLLVLQINSSINLMIQQLKETEEVLIAMALKYRDTPMIGRTLGQQATPITFGKKVSTWIAENRRNIERLKELQNRVQRMVILKGAVGNYSGLGDKAIALEKLFSKKLGLKDPSPADWHGIRDTIAEYALTLALISKGVARIGEEIYLLQMTEIGELNEGLKKGVVGSSTMPHKINPDKLTGMRYDGQHIPSLSYVLLEDVINLFERDNTKQVNNLVATISIASWDMMHNAYKVLSTLQVHPKKMLANLHLTKGLIMSQRVTFALAKKIGKTTANNLMHHVANKAHKENISLKEAMKSDPKVSKLLTDAQMNTLLDPTTYTGLSGKQVDRVIHRTRALQKTDP